MNKFLSVIAGLSCVVARVTALSVLDICESHPDHSVGLERAFGASPGGPDFQVLDGGLSSVSLYTFVMNEQKYVLRLLPTKHGSEKRAGQIAAHQMGANLGIAPELTYVDPEGLFVVMPFIEGHTLGSADLDCPDTLMSLGRALRALHSATPVAEGGSRQVDRAIKHVEHAFKQGTALPTGFELYYEQYLASTTRPSAYCHGDLHPANILTTEGDSVQLIDWSGTYDDPWDELGYLTFLGSFTDAQSAILLCAYLDREPTNEDFGRLSDAQRRTAFLTAAVWLDCSESAEDKKAPLSVRIERLDQCLGSTDLRRGRDYLRRGDLVPPLSKRYEEIRLCGLGFLLDFSDWESQVAFSDS